MAVYVGNLGMRQVMACTKRAQLKVEKEWERGYDWGSGYKTMKG